METPDTKAEILRSFPNYNGNIYFKRFVFPLTRPITPLANHLQQQTTAQTPTAKPKQKSSSVKDAAYVIAIIVIGLAVVFMWPHQASSNIVNGLITVKANGYNYYSFTIPNGASNIHLQGDFSATGGSNTIQVLIMNSTTFTNWKSGHPVTFQYYSGRMTKTSFDVQLPTAGEYYLVYDNGFSLSVDKDVDTKVNLIYNQRLDVTQPIHWPF